MAKPSRRKPAKKKPAAKSRNKPAKSPPKAATPRKRRRPLHEKAAIRSDAFAKAILDAKSYTADPETLSELFREASAKVASIPKTALNELGPYLQAMLRLIRAYA